MNSGPGERGQVCEAVFSSPHFFRHLGSTFNMNCGSKMKKKRRHGVVPSSTSSSGDGEIVEVVDLRGIRVVKEDDGRPRVEYLVEWKDGSPDTWEPATNLADDLLRDYEQRWWGAVRKGDENTLMKMIEGGGPVLARTVDDSRRSALHFAAALGRVNLVRALLAVGAEVDLADKEGESQPQKINTFCSSPQQ